MAGEFLKNLNNDIREDIKRYGMRNSHHNTIAPTGTISLLANNISNGIEPIFHAAYSRHVRGVDSATQTFQVRDYALNLWQQQKQSGLPSAWVDAQSLMPDAHLNIQAAAQPFIDNAISKTINIPSDFPFAELENVYSKAYQLGLKGCTVFRPNPITGSVLEIDQGEIALDHCCQNDEV